MKKYFPILRKCPLFDNISDEELPGMLGCLGATVISCDKKNAILSEGDPAKYVGILLSGSAQIIRIDYFGNRSIVANISPAELFAESFACADVKKLPVDIIATDDCDVLFIDCAKIMHPCCNACSFHQQIIYNLMKIMADKNLIYHQKIEITSRRTTRDKLLTYLAIQSAKNKSNSFDIPYDRQALADYLEVERSGLSSEIGKLQREGILKCSRNHFELTDISDFFI